MSRDIHLIPGKIMGLFAGIFLAGTSSESVCKLGMVLHILTGIFLMVTAAKAPAEQSQQAQPM